MSAVKTVGKHARNAAADQGRGLKDEHELQSYFINRIEKFLNSKADGIIEQDEILEEAAQYHRNVVAGVKGGIAAARMKHPDHDT